MLHFCCKAFEKGTGKSVIVASWESTGERGKPLLANFLTIVIVCTFPETMTKLFSPRKTIVSKYLHYAKKEDHKLPCIGTFSA